MEALLIKYGYFLLFLGVAVEGEAFLLAASFLAHRGYFHLSLVIVVAIAANWAADQIYYVVARSRGKRWLEDRFSQNPHYPRVLDLMARYANWLLLGAVMPLVFASLSRRPVALWECRACGSH
jgi:membrane protein DedA with SNARE-associated domain